MVGSLFQTRQQVAVTTWNSFLYTLAIWSQHALADYDLEGVTLSRHAGVGRDAGTHHPGNVFRSIKEVYRRAISRGGHTEPVPY